MFVFRFLFFVLSFSAAAAFSVAAVRHSSPDSLWVESVENGVQLETAVVTGTGTRKTLADTPVRTRLITADDIKKSDAFDLRQLLQHELPGVEFSKALSQHTVLNFSGFGGQQLLFLINGERLAGENMGNVDFSRINLADVERIEIVKGVSALYGSDAAGGVINVITRQQRSQPWTWQIDWRKSAHNDRKVGTSHTLNRRRWAHTVQLHHTAHDTYFLPNPPDAALYGKYVLHRISGEKTWNMNERFVFRPTDQLRLSARAGYFFRQHAHDSGEDQRYRDFSGGLKAEWTPSDERRLELSYAFDQYDKSDFHREKRLDLRDYSNVLHAFRVLYARPLNALSKEHSRAVLLLGGDGQRDYLSSRQLGENGIRHRYSADVFAELDWTLDRHWSVVAATRYDYLTDTKQGHPTGKLSARYRRGAFTLRAGCGSGYRVPTLKERFMHFHLRDLFIIRGNENLRPEKSRGLHLSAEWAKNGWSLETSTDYQRIARRITTTRPSDERDPKSRLPYVDYVNVPRFEVFNVETTAQHRRRHRNHIVTARLAYAFTHEKARERETLTPYMPARPHSLTARLDYRHASTNAFDGVLSGRFLSAIRGEEYNTLTHEARPFRYPAYFLLKLSLRQQFGRGVQLYATIDNLLDYRPRVYLYNSPPTTGITLTAGVRLDLHALRF